MGKKEIKILVVDDEEDFCYFVRRNLERTGYKVATVSDSKSAVRVAKHEKPNLILLDIMMPGMNGFDVLKALKDDKKTFAIPVVMLTGIDDDAARQRAASLYNEDYIIKPVLVEELQARLQKVLAARGLGES